MGDLPVFAPAQNANKIKDPGLADMLEHGLAVHNAKTSLTCLLPLGIEAMNALVSDLHRTCEQQGITVVAGCDPSVLRSMAERYLKDYPQREVWAHAGEELHILGWHTGTEDASRAMEALALEKFGLTAIPVAPREDFCSYSILCAPTATPGAIAGVRCGCGFHATNDSLCGKRKKENAHTPEELCEVHTPGATTIAELCHQMDIAPKDTLKTLIFKTPSGLVMALLRGDRELSMEKLSAILGEPVERAPHQELSDLVGDVAGFCGPIGVKGSVRMIADLELDSPTPLVAGANKADYHLRGVTVPLHIKDAEYMDIVSWRPGNPCPSCGAELGPCAWRQAGLSFRYPQGHDPIVVSTRDGKVSRDCMWGAALNMWQLLLVSRETLATPNDPAAK